MKKLFIIAALLFPVLATAQQLQNLPDDPAVRKGQLENGLTYYIRHNDKPEGRAEFYLATNVGAIQETPDQDGLAHFLEHMCFNGTKNLPGKSMLNYLQSIGASFGGNINASTGFEQTKYMLNNMPVTREGVIDTCLLVMHDYSHFVLNEIEEIDKERPVIIEERRTRRDASWRLFEQSLPYYYGDSKYATCTLIGSQENLETFKRESLVNFYETWYRPDLQAVIVVGDIDVDQIENKIKTIFADIPAKENPKPKDYIKVPDNEEPVIGILTDPECPSSSVEVLWKRDARPEAYNSTMVGMLTDLLSEVVGVVMSERFKDITASTKAPFLSGSLGVGNLCETCEVTMARASAREGELPGAFRALLTEAEKMRRFGFTDEEVERAKSTILASYESAAKKASTRKNPEFVRPLINNFFDNYSYMEPEMEYQLVQNLFQQIQTPVINQYAAQLVTKENMVVIFQAPEKEGLAQPEEAAVRAIIDEVWNSELEANVSEAVASDFLDPAALKGSKVKKTAAGAYGSTVWTLKNGAKVVALPTGYTKNQIIFTASKEGGRSLIATEDLASFEQNFWMVFLSKSGVGGFSAPTVQKMLSGKNINVSPFISSFNHGLNGVSTPADLETAFQIIYLMYTQPRVDQDEFDQAKSMLGSLLPNLESQPSYQFQKAAYETLYGNNPRRAIVSESTLAAASPEAISRVLGNLYNDAAGLTFYVVGDFELDTLKPLIEKYIGSIPKGRKPLTWKDMHDGIVTGTVDKTVTTNMQTPKSTVLQVYSLDDVEYTVANEVALDAIEYILDMRYVDSLREDEGGTYGAGVEASLDDKPAPRASIMVSFDTKPSAAGNLKALAAKGLKDLAESGPTEEEMSRTVLNMQKNIPERRITNSYWRGCLRNYYEDGIDEDVLYEQAVNALTAEQVKSLAARIVSSGNFIQCTLAPENAAERE